MRHLIQYHNPDRFGPPDPPQEGERFYVMTSKRTAPRLGSCMWLISGEGRPRRYYLREVFIVDRWQAVLDPDFFYEISGEQGVGFQPPIELTGYPWFEEMKYRLGNFSLGLTEITNTYARTLISLAHDQSPAYRQGEAAGRFQRYPDS